MRLVALPDGVGRIDPDGSVAVLDVPQPSLGEWLGSGCRAADAARLPVADRLPLAGLRPGARLSAGATVWGIGMNYASKRDATGRTPPDEPTLFVKTGAAFSAPDVLLPAAAPDCVDFEGEIAAIVGETLYEADPNQAAAAVALVTPANDVTARDVMRRTGNPSLAKSFPGFGQLGSVYADPETFGGLDQIPLETVVNGELRQRDRSDGMLISIGELLALLSRYAVLRPGDVVLTGTPAGTGDETTTYLGVGDAVEVRVGDLPVLSSRVAGRST